MGLISKKKSKKLDLLAMPDVEKYKLIKAVKENLQQKVAERKLMQSFLDSESLTINGETVHCEENQLTVSSIKAELLKGM